MNSIDTYDRDRYFVRFFLTSIGELRCRITNMETSQSWLVRNAFELQRLLRDRDDAEKKQP